MNRRPMSPAQGFTLIELLVVMAILGVIGTLIISFFTTTSQSVTEQTRVASQTGQIQRALGLIADDIRRADKLVVTGSATPLDFGGIGVTTPAQTGASRLDLYVLRPASGSPCATTSGYEYRSYFTVARGALTTGSMNAWVRLPEDTDNAARNVLLQYVGCADTLTGNPTYGSLRPVVDHVGNLTFTQTASNVSVALQGQRQIGARTFTTPLASGTYYSRRY